jgi:hypothetical protein
MIKHTTVNTKVMKKITKSILMEKLEEIPVIAEGNLINSKKDGLWTFVFNKGVKSDVDPHLWKEYGGLVMKQKPNLSH